MKLKYTAKAKGQLKRLPAHVQDKVLSVIEDIKREPLFAGDRLSWSKTMSDQEMTDRLYRIRQQNNQSSATALAKMISGGKIPSAPKPDARV